MKVNGLYEYTQRLKELGTVDKVNRVVKTAIYDGAKIIADAIKEEIDTIPVVGPNDYGTTYHPLNGATQEQLEGLRNGVGIALMRQSDSGWDTKVGFSGYNSKHTDAYPEGQPNLMIAASIESGASFRRKNPFITRAIRRSKQIAVKAMDETAEKQIMQIYGGI